MLLSHSVRGTGILEQLTWYFWITASPEDVIIVLGGLTGVIGYLTGAASKMVPSHGCQVCASFWKKTLVLHHMDLSRATFNLITGQLTSHRVSDQKERTRWKPQWILWSGREVKLQHFYSILLVTQISHLQCGIRPYTGVNTRRCENHGIPFWRLAILVSTFCP